MKDDVTLTSWWWDLWSQHGLIFLERIASSSTWALSQCSNCCLATITKFPCMSLMTTPKPTLWDRRAPSTFAFHLLRRGDTKRGNRVVHRISILVLMWWINMWVRDSRIVAAWWWESRVTDHAFWYCEPSNFVKLHIYRYGLRSL